MKRIYNGMKIKAQVYIHIFLIKQDPFKKCDVFLRLLGATGILDSLGYAATPFSQTTFVGKFKKYLYLMPVLSLGGE